MRHILSASLCQLIMSDHPGAMMTGNGIPAALARVSGSGAGSVALDAISETLVTGEAHVRDPRIKSPEYQSEFMPNVWVYDGEAYDLTEFITKHPGGEFFIGRMKNRDITTVMNTMHANPAVQKRMLQKYALNRKAVPSDVHPSYNAPPFLFKQGFSSFEDTPRYDFEKSDSLLERIKQRLRTPEMGARVAKLDRWFDTVTVMMLVAYIVVQALFLTNPTYVTLAVFVPLMVILRLSLAGSGHYLNHRALAGWNKSFCHIFDLSYVSMAFVVVDGHTLMHHPHTQSEADVKRNVFTAMMELPRGYRIPLHTLHKIGHLVTGMLFRCLEMTWYAIRYNVRYIYRTRARSFKHYLGMFVVKFVLLAELVLFWQHDLLLAWFLQFFITLWISTFLIVASHDFEEEEAATHPSPETDWAAFQIEHAYDLAVTGNRYVDVFLSSGLSPHRAHHVLPYQKSGFSNVASEDIVREEAEHWGLTWDRPKRFVRERVPSITQQYLLSPSRRASEHRLSLLSEHFSLDAVKDSLDYVLGGFKGRGSI